MEKPFQYLVSDKTISKWETGKGLPDISLIEPLAKALKVSVIELMNGEYRNNNNQSGNMLKSKFSVCPICGNIIHSMGENINSCCGITLPVLEAENEDEEHIINCEIVEDEYYITIKHEMTKKHYISFIAYVTQDKFEFIKLYMLEFLLLSFISLRYFSYIIPKSLLIKLILSYRFIFIYNFIK